MKKIFLITVLVFTFPTLVFANVINLQLNETYEDTYISRTGCGDDIEYSFANNEKLNSVRLNISTPLQSASSVPAKGSLNTPFNKNENAFIDIPLTGPMTFYLTDKLCVKKGASIPYEITLTQTPKTTVSVVGIAVGSLFNIQVLPPPPKGMLAPPRVLVPHSHHLPKSQAPVWK